MLKRPLLLSLVFAVLVAPARATWSVLILDRRTGEVAVGVATCVQRLDLTQGLPAIVPGRGAGIVQSGAMPNVLLPLYDGILAGDHPEAIMLAVRAAGPQAALQAGIVTLDGFASYSGGGTTDAFGNYVGELGDLVYAIQGNVLSGDSVLRVAEQTLLATPGDLATKLMAVMRAARDQGGDGRCSCDQYELGVQGSQLFCGDPPPSFTKAAHSAALLITRLGDPLPPCNVGIDCAQAQGFYLRLVIKQLEALPSSPDPIFQLEERFEIWKANRVGRPDGHLSRLAGARTLPADGSTRTELRIQLVDREGTPLRTGGARVTVATVDGERTFGSYGPVKDHGDGSYSFAVEAGNRPGRDRLRITVQDDFLKATLSPLPELEFVSPGGLLAGRSALSASQPEPLPLFLERADAPGAEFVLLGEVLEDSGGKLRALGRPRLLAGTFGRLDASGRARLSLGFPPQVLTGLVGRRLRLTAHFPEATAGAGDVTVMLDVLP